MVGRAELLSAIFFIGSFLAYNRAARNKGGGKTMNIVDELWIATWQHECCKKPATVTIPSPVL